MSNASTAMTQEQLAEASGVSKLFVSQIEGGKRTESASTLARFARALVVPMGALLREDGR